MTFEEALAVTTAVLAPRSLSGLQADVFQGAWNKQSYLKIALELHHREGYIKDVGAELWQLLTQALGIKVTKLNLQDALAQYVQQRQMRDLHTFSQKRRVDWGEAPDVSQFCGRQAQLATLEQWVIQDCCRLVAIVGMGGIGKTRLATRLAQQIAEQFEVVVWRSLRQAPPLLNLLTELMQVIAPDQSLSLQLDVAMRQLLEQLRRHRCLLIFDNVEAVLSSSELVGTYQAGYEGYGWLFQHLGQGRHQSSVLLTSRETPTNVAIQEGPKAPVRLLQLERLLIEEGKAILAAKGLSVQTEPLQVQELIERYHGNPLALEIIVMPLKDLFDSNISAFLAQETLLFKDIRDLLTQQFNRLSLLEQQVMYWLAINREAVSAAQLQADLMPSVSQVELRDALGSLDRRSLIEKLKPTSAKPAALMKLNGVGYTQQPVVMEYVTERLIEQVCQEVVQAEIIHLRSHALLKAQAKDYVRDVQVRLIVQPILTKLLELQGGSENLQTLLLQLLRIQQLQAPLQPGYFAGNAINLLRQLGADLSHLDFSNLTIWQADLRMMTLQGTNFCKADLSGSIFTQAISEILCVAFRPDAKHIATSHGSGEICVWQVEDGQLTAAFRGIASPVNSLVFTPDGETLIVSGQDGIVKLLHISSGTVRGKLHEHTGAVWSVAISADGRLLASGGEDLTIKIWEMQTGKCLKTLEGLQGWLASLAFTPAPQTPDGSYHLASADRTIRLWNIQTGQTLHIFEGHTHGVLAVAFSPDGQQIASSSVDHTIRLWDVQTGHEIAAWEGHSNASAWTLAFSPNGQILASGGEDQTVKLWDIETQQCHRTLLGHTGVVQSIAYSLDGLTLVSAALNQSIRLWDAQTGHCLKTWQGYSKGVFCAVFHPNGRMLASSHGDNMLRLWDVKTGDCLSCLSGHTDRIASVAFSPDGWLLASGSFDQTIRLWDTQTGNFLRALRIPSWVSAIAFSADGTLLASSGVDRAVRLWDVQTGQCLRVIESEANWIPAVAFSPTEHCLASGNEDGTVKLWNTNTSDCLLTLEGHTRQAQAIAFDPADQRLASGSDDHTVKLWDLQTGQCLQTLQGHTHPVVSISFHPQGNLIASGGLDQTLKLWDLEQGINIATLQGHTSPIRSIMFDPEGQMLVSSSDDGTIRLWDSGTGDCLRVLTVARPYEGMNISGVAGLTDAQKETLRVLGAIEN
ncbi:High-affinity carbon uptake protein Hat/HatR [uncultured Leptolyngbya sp.]|uniref:High-affinity carbon uptake protein Hat/HatR n=2 Tax=Cyanophyceae TaxID=3028117 RepID=A0A6J4MHP4_9CYAN|nr:High-affinity carbon uptake protein Hat/HatR [uncultured Leptolyngbya sp.]CAA9569269.1 High-affinity carbon uptake protein Hat/HatR [uncultured Synechococcales cyanobacterium]